MNGDTDSCEVEKEIISQILEPRSDIGRNAKILREMLNRGVVSFDSKHLAKMIISNARSAFSVYGREFLQALTGMSILDLETFEGKYERLDMLKKTIDKKLTEMKKAGYIITEINETKISEKGIELAAISTIIDEMDIVARFGSGDHKVYTTGNTVKGYPLAIREYRRGDSYKDISVRQTIKRAMLRGHEKILKEDLRVFERTKSVNLDIVYLLDISGSMHGKKIDAGKKAAIGLAIQGTRVGDRIGVIAFNTKPYRVVNPTTRVKTIARHIVSMMPSSSTDIAAAISEARKMLDESSHPEYGKHIILITDAIPTSGDDDPVENTYREVNKTIRYGITISVVGIDLTSEGEEIARNITRMARGRFYHIENPDELNKIVLMEQKIARTLLD